MLILLGKAPSTEVKEEQAMEEGDPSHKQWPQGNAVYKDLSDLGKAVTTTPVSESLYSNSSR